MGLLGPGLPKFRDETQPHFLLHKRDAYINETEPHFCVAVSCFYGVKNEAVHCKKF